MQPEHLISRKKNYESLLFEEKKIYLDDFFENQPNEICSLLSEKASKGMFLACERQTFLLAHRRRPSAVMNEKNVFRSQASMFPQPEKLQNHSNEGKGKEKKKERGEGKEEKKKKQWLHS